MIDSEFVKQKAVALGADICNIVSESRFKDAPQGFHPTDIFPECQSVVVFLSHFPLSSLSCKSLAPYTISCDALDGMSIVQKSCRKTSFSWSPGDGVMYECNSFRTICPSCKGI